MEVKEKRRRLGEQGLTLTSPVPSTSVKGLGTMATRVEDLPEELLLRILNLLPNGDLIDVVPYVCLRWRRLSLDSQIWKNRMYFVGREDSDLDVEEFFGRKPALKSVFFLREVGDDVLRSLASLCPTITSLLLWEQGLTLDTLRVITRNCDQIRYLTIHSKALTCRDRVREVALMPRLERLCVYGIHPLHLRELGAGCEKLRHLELIMGYFPLGDLGTPLLGRLQQLTISWNSVTRNIVHCAENLEKLTLENFLGCSRLDCFLAEHLLPLKALTDVVAENFRQGPQVVRALMQPLLRSLNLRGSTTVDDDLLLELCGRCLLLEDLDLSSCHLITARGLSSMWRLRRLRRLCLNSCEGLGSGVMVHLARLDGLQELIMEGVNMECMEPGVSELLELRNLRVLVFNAWSARGLIPWEMLLKAFPDLRTLQLGEWKSPDTSIPESLKVAMSTVDVTWFVEDDL